ncbi:MFS transporter [Microlunatus soli]|uniref:Predicted arabinose efflux permease, MFS family n=1 Tax=Microlunatus soli TaxID=630515 RepID=A0A1H1WS76_9ACTN|nr:MFS transporter [Microlunatus soli]SDS99206.1 Predicted arabinose efflux permease, MFS family [Microlunatus soli]
MNPLLVLRRTHVARLMAGTLSGRLPSAMAAVMIPLILREHEADYGFVGLVAAVYAIASAVGGPMLARLVDRVGQPWVLVGSSVLSGLGFIVIAVAAQQHGVVVIAAAVAGAAMPPLEPCLRALWPDVVDHDQLDAAYAVDSAAQELIFVGGPLLVSVCVALGSAAHSLWLGAGLGLLGSIVVATAGPSRHWRAPRRSADWLGPLRSSGLVVLLLSLAGVGGALGMISIFAVAYAEQHPVPGGAPVLLAINAAGALTGGIAYGAVRWSGPAAGRIAPLLVGYTVAYGLLVLSPGVAVTIILMYATGLFLAPILAASFAEVGTLAPPGTTTEAFAWLVSLMTVGVSLGSAVTGILIGSGSLPRAALTGVVSAALGLLTLLLGRSRLTPAQPAAH